MPKPIARCSCGRPMAQAHSVVQRIDGTRYTHFRCECGKEWTKVNANLPRQNEPVTSDEVLDVHVALAKFEGTLRDLLGVLDSRRGIAHLRLHALRLQRPHSP